MLGTALRQLRYGFALVRGGRVRVGDLNHLVEDLVATRAEMGEVDIGGGALMQGTTDPDARQAVNARRWRITLQRAYDQTTYYRSRLDERGAGPAELTLDRRHELTPTPKDAPRHDPAVFLSRTSTPSFRARTTGTTGPPTTCWFSRYEIDLAAALGAMSFVLHSGFGPDDVLQMCLSSQATLEIYGTILACRLIGTGSVPSELNDPDATLAELAAPLDLPGKKPKVSLVSIHPLYLSALVAAAERGGYRPSVFGLERIMSGGGILSDALRHRASEVFGTEVQDIYTMTEAVPLRGITCGQGHLHISDEPGLVEVLDPQTYEPVPPGQVGEMVVTPFFPFRETMHVIRLATGDLVRRLPDRPVTCELAAVPATGPLLGRTTITTRTRMGQLYERDILDLLEGDRGVPLPCRYAVEGHDDDIDLHVLVTDDDALISKRLQHEAEDRSLPLRRVLLHTDERAMPPIAFRRALRRETTVGVGEHGP